MPCRFHSPAPAQPDARDAEIARLREERDFERGQRDLRHAAYIEERDKAARLTNELEEVRAALRTEKRRGDLNWSLALKEQEGRLAAKAQAKDLREALEFARRLRMAKKNRAILTAALAPPEPKAETPAETAGQKEGP